MAIYQWVGGYTGFTGSGSGYSPTGAGASGDQPYWTSVISGATSVIGDIFYAPYAWNMTQNWRKAITTTGQVGNYQYVTTSALPKGGDTVWFSGGFTSGTGSYTNTYSVSCYYGGMSGDGLTASGSTAWSGGYTASGDMFGNITFVVKNTFAPTYHPVFETGSVGVAGGNGGDFSVFAPLNIRTTSFSFIDSSTVSVTGFAVDAPTVAINNISTGSSNFQTTNLSGIACGVVYLQGNWEWIYQRGGYMFLSDITNTYGGNLLVQGNVKRFSANATTSIGTYSVYPGTIQNDGYIYGNYGGSAKVYIGNYAQNAPITIGSLNDGTTPTFEVLEVGTIGGGTGGTGSPNIKLASCQIDVMKCNSGNIGVSPLNSGADYPIIRDGYMRQGTLDMAHPTDPNWQQFLLGFSPSDNGLRIDDPDAVTIKGYIGTSFKTGSPESLTGYNV